MAGALVLVGFVYALGPPIYYDVRAARIRAKGASIEGTIIEAKDTHHRYGGDPEIVFLLEIHPPGAAGPVRGEVHDAVSPLHLPRFQPGARVQVFYDPEDPTAMALEDGL